MKDRTIKIDPAIEQAFSLYGINANSCIDVEGSPNGLVLRFRGKLLSLTDFLNGHAKLIGQDRFPSQDPNQVSTLRQINEEIRSLGYNESDAERLRIEYNRDWFIIKLDGKGVGFGDRGVIYNGFPKNIDFQDILNDSSRAYNEALADLRLRDPKQPLPAPYSSLFITLGFTPEFIKSHPIKPVR